MDFEPDRFAFSYARAFCFASSGNAYDATQTDAAISRGAILPIASERIVGLADTWPNAVTQAHGVNRPANGDRDRRAIGDRGVDARLRRCGTAEGVARRRPATA
jgi:hypothetical protein